MKTKLMEATNCTRARRFYASRIVGWAVLSFVATAIAQTAPIVLTQPRSQIAAFGTNVTLSITIAGSAPLPPVGSGTLQLWLKADTGVVTNASGLVSQWQDQSSNTNHAAQANTNLQPTLVYASELGGKPVVQFNGIQNNINGSYMFGPGNVDVPNAMTAFTIYNVLAATNAEDLIWEIGYPNAFGANRIDILDNGDMYFSFWSFGNDAPFAVPTNTFRLRTDRLDTNEDTLEMFDATASSATNFTQSVDGAVVTPAAGYYLGGLNTAVGGPFVGSSRNFYGDIAEVLVYQGYLTDADRLAVDNYLEQKYEFIGVTNGASFQWQLDGTNIAGATNAILTLNDVQTNESGTYTVIITNLSGSTTASNAILTVGYAPSISTQPQSQEVLQGSNATFTVGANGSGPLSFQWFLDGAALTQGTSSTLLLTNAQAASGGYYSVLVSNLFGSVLSSNAPLTVDLFPVILVQPQSQGAVVGNDVTLSVAANGTTSTLPSVTSGTLQLWLKADSGVVANGAGQVSQWYDQSSNSNNAAQTNINLQPTLASAAGLSGRPVVRFNGIQNNINGSYLFGPGLVNVPQAMTAFTVYDAFSTTNQQNLIWEIGYPDSFGANRIAIIASGDMYFSFWSYDFPAPFVVPTNTYRILTDRLDTNLDTLNIFDATADSATNFTLSVNGAVTPAAGYYLGGLNTSVGGPFVGSSRNFDGDIAEVLVYQGYLGEADRQAVASYLEQKYFQSGAAEGLTYQWEFDGTNIAGATNASLTLTALQSAEVGTYAVTISNEAGSITSSNAILTALSPPAITSSPSNQTVVAGTTVTFSAGATGTAPLTFQWLFDGANISGATNTSLTVSNALAANAGSYWMVASSPYGLATSSTAVLSVDETTIQIVSTNAAGGGTVVVSIDMNAVGTETAVGFTLNFDPSVLTFQEAVLGSGGAGGAPEVNTNQAAAGVLGLGVDLFSGAFTPGTNDVFDVTFQIAPVTNETTTLLTFANRPTQELVVGAQAQTLPAIFVAGNIVIPPTVLAGDVSPRPNGNEVVNIADWVQEGRFVAGLDTVSNGSEFQRADCAPRATQGDGQITVADWVQVGRYAVGLDPVTAAGGPTSPISPMALHGHPVKTGLTNNFVMLTPLSQGPATSSVAVELSAQGNANALGFSVTFDPTLVHFVNASLGSGATGAALIQNTSQAGAGTLGFVVGLEPPGTFAAGTQPLVNLNFTPIAYSNSAALVFGNTPVVCQLVDANANPLSANYQNATLAVGGSTWPAIAISQTGTNIVLSWPFSAALFGFQVAPSLQGPWSNVVVNPVTNGDSLVITSPISTNSQFFRLKY